MLGFSWLCEDIEGPALGPGGAWLYLEVVARSICGVLVDPQLLPKFDGWLFDCLASAAGFPAGPGSVKNIQSINNCLK